VIPSAASPYRLPQGARLHVCAGCSAAAEGPLAGGPARCARCGAEATLPDRSALLATPIGVVPPDNGPARLEALRAQDGRPRLAPATLQAVLGGPSILPGREQEAILVWQSLRARAAAGDVAASEDLSLLTLMLAALPAVAADERMAEALGESAFDACVLPRHKQEQLGRLLRRAVGRGDHARAMRLLATMTPNPPDLDGDSEYRVAAAAIATLERDPERVLVFLGQTRSAVPIDDAMDDHASVFRANAWELRGDVATATQILHELPDPSALERYRAVYPALALCARSAPAYAAQATEAAAARAAGQAGTVSGMLGLGLGLTGAIVLAASIGMVVLTDRTADDLIGAGICGVIGLFLTVLGVGGIVASSRAKRRAAWLRTNGLSLLARVVDTELTGTSVNDVPLHRLRLRVAAPQGAYDAALEMLLPEHEVARLLGQDVRVRVAPDDPTDVMFET
jgi:hypothetical protein